MMQETLLSTLESVLPSKVFPQLAAEGTSPPFVVYVVSVTEPQSTLAGDEMLYRSTVQIAVYADTYSEAVGIAENIKAIMDSVSLSFTLTNSLAGQQDSYENEARLHRVVLDFNVWHY